MLSRAEKALASTSKAQRHVGEPREFQYELLQPYPVSWNHGPRERELLQVSRERRGLVVRIASAQRIGSIGDVRLPLETTAEHQEALKAELAALDARIAALRAAIGAQPER